jgi:dolichyl-phosphate beta-glucosyltransferase
MKKVYETEKDNVRLLPLVQNYGKGFAVQQGVIRARGKQILMADADAATEISDLERLEKQLRDKAVGSGELYTKKSIAIGSRSHLEADAKVRTLSN